MTEEEKSILRRIAEVTTRIVDQQARIARLTAENQPTNNAVELLCALLDSMRVQQDRLQILRSGIKDQSS